MAIIQQAEQFVFDLFKDRLSPSFTYHNFNHTLRVVMAAEKLALAEKIDGEATISLLLAAWFHDSGYINGAADHEIGSVILLKEFLSTKELDGKIESLASALIMATEMDKSPNSLLEMIIRDADSSHFGSESYADISELLRNEWKLTQNKTYSDAEWTSENSRVLTSLHRFYTDSAKKNWQSQKDANIAMLFRNVADAKAEIITETEQEAAKTKKAEKANKPDRGIDTMFRVTLKNHTQLSQIADSKANILLSVNAIIISISLSTLIPKLDSPGNAHLILPTFIMIFFCVVSIVFAILSTRPKVSTGQFTRKDIEERKINLLFFGNFHNMPLEEYQWAMNEMMKEKEYLYNSLIKDLYFLGLVLERKYKLLRITYNVFMIGIIITVIVFVAAFKNAAY